MSILTIILFFAYTYGLGFTITSFVRNPDNLLERNLMRIGIGLGIFPILSVAINFFHIPLDWRIFLSISLIYPLIILFSKIKNNEFSKINIKLTKYDLYTLLVLLMFAFTLNMYLKGSFAYPYLEDSDPWHHAMGAKFVSIEKTAFEPIPGKLIFHYMDAYPPSYDILMGILHQTSQSINWSLKFFNALIISLGIIFFYFFVKEFTESKRKALFSAFVLTMIPSYLSHFVWAHALVVTLIFPLFYSLERTRSDSKYWIISALIFSSILVTQITQALKIGVLFAIYFIIRCFMEKKFLKQPFFSGLAGLFLSLVFWWVPMLLKHGSGLFSAGFGMPLNFFISSGAGKEAAKKYIGFLGSATRPYTFKDFFIAKSQNMINNPIGVGIVLCILLLLSLIFVFIKYNQILKKLSKKNTWILITLFWLIFTFLGIHGGTKWWSPFALWSFRFWMLFAIPVSLLAGYAIEVLLTFVKSIEKQLKLKNVMQILFIVLLVFGLWKTSGYQKYQVNTAIWGAGSFWRDPGALQSFVWLKENTPINTRVFTFPAFGSSIIGMDGFSCEWCSEVIQFREEMENKTAEEFHKWLKQNDYEYILLSSYYYSSEYGTNATINKINNLISSNLFAPVYQPVIQEQKSASMVFKITS